MSRTAFTNNCGYSNNYKPNSCSSSNPPSPATSTSSELDHDLSASFCVSYSAMDMNREVSPYAHSVLTHASGARRASNMSTDANRSARTSKRSSRSSKMHQDQPEEEQVVLEARAVRALLLYVRESRLQLHENETKLRNMEKAMEAFQKSHEQQMLILAKSFVFLQNQLAAQNQNPQSSPRKTDETPVTDSRLSEIFPSNPDLFVPGQLNNPEKANEEDPDFEDLDLVTADRDQNFNKTQPAVKPLYAVVKKKRSSMTPDSPPLPPPPSNWPEDPISLPQPPQTPPLDFDEVEHSNLDQDSSRLDSQGSSTQSQEQLSEISSSVGNFTPDALTSPTNSEFESPLGERNHKKYRPLPNRPQNEEANDVVPVLMPKRHSHDGYYISSTLNRRRSSGRYETVEDEKRPHAQSFTPQPRPKAAQLLSKFKKKLKDTKRIVARATSKDSVGSESPTISDPVFDDRVQVTIATGSVNVISCKDDSNNNSFFHSTDNLAAQRRPFYENTPHQIQANHRRLDSTGDNESRSTDTSDMQLNENSPVPSALLYRRHQVPPLENATKTRWLESKVPSSPNLLQVPNKSPVRRSCSLDVALRLSERSSEPEFPDPPTDSSSSSTPSQGSLSGSNDLLSSEDSLNNKLDEAGYILDDVIQQQEEIEKLETMGSTPGEPPPKPSRPGFANPARGYASQSSSSIYQPTAPPPGGMYPLGPRAPGIPPKNMSIMTHEQLVSHEAQANLKRIQMEEGELQRTLAEQKREALEDDLWIRNQEMQGDQTDIPTNDAEHQYHSADDMKKNRAAGTGPPPKPSRTHLTAKVPQPAPAKVKFEEVKPTPTMKLDREGDNVYRDTMSVVKSVLQSNHRVMEAGPDDIFTFVKNIGKALKELCTSLNVEMTTLPEQFHREIDMAQKTTNKDLSQIINQMKLVRKFFATTQVDDYKKCLMAANQVLAMDAKNLLDAVDKARFHKLGQERDATPPVSEPALSEEASSSATTSSSTPPPPNAEEEEEG